jgi:hypothetical protein
MAYIMFDGSSFYNTKTKKRGYYKGLNELYPSKIPEDVKKFLLDNGYDNSKVEIKEKNNIDSNITLKDMEITKDKNLYIPKSHLKQILDDKPLTYFNDVEFWKFTTIMKYLDAYDLWDEFNKKRDGYNLNENIKIWNSVNPNRCNINLLIDLFHNKDIRGYYNLKHLPKFSLESEKINKNKLGYDFIQEKRNYIIKSDTGTGKTTSVKHFLNKTNDNFISIVSRVSLGQEQFNNFNEDNFLKCKFYQQVEFMKNEYNIIIQLDSLLKVHRNIDISQYVIVLDEFESILDHLFNSPTLKTKRVLIFMKFIEILKECKNFICIDADITNKSVEFIETFINRKYELFENEYKHNKGVEALEIPECNVFIENLKKENKFLCCCDSKTQAEYIEEKLFDETVNHIINKISIYMKDTVYWWLPVEEKEYYIKYQESKLEEYIKSMLYYKGASYIKCIESIEYINTGIKKYIHNNIAEELKNRYYEDEYNWEPDFYWETYFNVIRGKIENTLKQNYVVCITSDTDEYYNFDDYDKIIYSPKVIYGIDSTMERPVYCFYKEHTINPKKMVQQIARCRNITTLYYHFTKKTYNPNKITIEEVLKTNNKIIDYGIHNENKLIETNFNMIDASIERDYIKLFSKFEYENICYDTNKFCHFIKLLDQRGFILKTYRFKKYKTKCILSKEVLEPEEFFKKEKNKKILQIIGLDIDDDIIKDNMEIISRYNFVQEYLNIKHYFYDNLDDNQLLDRLNNQNEFILGKVSNNNQKLRLLLKFKEMTGCEDRYNLESTVLLNQDQINQFEYEYKIIFEKNKYYNENFDFSNLYNQDKVLNKLYKMVFTSIITKSKKKRIDGKLRYFYFINEEEYNKFKSLIDLRIKKQKDRENKNKIHNELIEKVRKKQKDIEEEPEVTEEIKAYRIQWEKEQEELNKYIKENFNGDKEAYKKYKEEKRNELFEEARKNQIERKKVIDKMNREKQARKKLDKKVSKSSKKPINVSNNTRINDFY